MVCFRHEERNQEKLASNVNVSLAWYVSLPYLDSGPDDEHIEAPIRLQYTASCQESAEKGASAKQVNDIKSNVNGWASSNDESTCRWCNSG